MIKPQGLAKVQWPSFDTTVLVLVTFDTTVLVTFDTTVLVTFKERRFRHLEVKHEFDVIAVCQHNYLFELTVDQCFLHKVFVLVLNKNSFQKDALFQAEASSSDNQFHTCPIRLPFYM